MENRAVLRIFVSGVVQGVGYRRWLQREAEARGVDGWVRNRTDGTVEAVIGGSQGQVGELVILCHAGPSRAKVSRVVTRKRERPVKPGFVRRKTFGARGAAGPGGQKD
jgi:acylphosphatase